jgi:hypothetical protein
MIDLKVKDTIRYDKEDSNFSWIGNVMKVCPKSVVVLNSGGFVERVSKSKIVKIY